MLTFKTPKAAMAVRANISDVERLTLGAIYQSFVQICECQRY